MFRIRLSTHLSTRMRLNMLKSPFVCRLLSECSIITVTASAARNGMWVIATGEFWLYDVRSTLKDEEGGYEASRDIEMNDSVGFDTWGAKYTLF